MPRGSKDGSTKYFPAVRDGRRIVKPERWEVRRRFSIDGKSHEKSRIAHSASEAIRIRRDIDAEIADEIQKAKLAAPQLVKKTFRELIAHCKANDMKPAEYVGDTKVAGLRSWESTWSALVPAEEFFGDRLIRQITRADREKFAAWFIRKPTVHDTQRSVTSLNRTLAWTRRAFYIALAEKWIDENPFAKPLIQTALEPKHFRILSTDEEARLFAQFTGKRRHLAFPVLMAIETMMRESEQFRLERKDINLERRLLTAISYKGKRAIRRFVPITDRLMPGLIAELNSHHESTLFTYSSPRTGFENAVKAAGLEDVTWHTLRHTGITRWVHVYKLEPSEVMKVSGHNNWKTFWETYVNTDEEIARTIGARIDAVRAQVGDMTSPPAVPDPPQFIPPQPARELTDIGDVGEVG